MRELAFIARKNGYILWSRGNYQYDITDGIQPYKVLCDLFGYEYEKALERFNQFTKENSNG